VPACNYTYIRCLHTLHSPGRLTQPSSSVSTPPIRVWCCSPSLALTPAYNTRKHLSWTHAHAHIQHTQASLMDTRTRPHTTHASISHGHMLTPTYNTRKHLSWTHAHAHIQHTQASLMDTCSRPHTTLASISHGHTHTRARTRKAQARLHARTGARGDAVEALPGAVL
jgi:hypothetical protein